MKFSKVYLAIITIFILELIALLKNIDGVIMSLSISAIAGLGGYSLGHITKKE